MNKFPKDERLNSRTKILNLFHEGNTSRSGPIKIVWKEEKLEIKKVNQTYIEAAFSVPKRLFKRAVKRNRIKRKMREVLRLNKPVLTDYLKSHDYKIYFLIIYLAEKEIPYSEIQKHIIKAFKNIIDALKYDHIKRYK